MTAVIKKKEKNRIMILGIITGVFGAVAGSIGLYLRIKLTTSESWEVPDGIPESTNSYFGVMSGFSLFLLGTAGYGLVYSRISYLVFLYWLCSLTCDILCVLDVVMVMPYTKDAGKFAWDNPDYITNSTCNTTYLHNINEGSCGIVGILLICIPTAVLIAFVLSSVTTILAGAAICSARGVSASDKPDIELAPYSTPGHFQPTSYNNTVWQTDGFRQ